MAAVTSVTQALSLNSFDLGRPLSHGYTPTSPAITSQSLLKCPLSLSAP